jgi:hypothetical protein
MKDRNMRKRKLLPILVAVIWSVTALEVAIAGDPVDHRIAGGMEVFLGVQPAALVSRVHPRDHPEAEMHGGAPKGRHLHHVLVAIFNAESGKRIEDATVEARLTPPGLATLIRSLEPMAIADTVTYGNYFNLAVDGRYQLSVSIRRSKETRPINVDFTYVHRTR